MACGGLFYGSDKAHESTEIPQDQQALVDAVSSQFPFPDPTGQFKLFYPAELTKGHPVSSYMSEGTAQFENQRHELANNTLQGVQIQAYRGWGAPISSINSPVVIFSPGMGASRCLYTATLLDIASRGYFVVAVDHPYDADVVQFPDGRLVKGIFRGPTPEQIEKAMIIRTQDVSFVLD
ncbi:hypothetical protein K493DRAFT_306063 [Basidiobolus meristosporus CBS 931.73]|uniref:1-alkyl-2-acetylglycerophosphocholine esterase n=1 Tax=Basidiobolus meristosporus CBS 931.73 TaxID=1314790 RepID=A0A1Y1XTI8_9FUNG|nr:hypothetical protein K493DRAFT_306063 [Basidiobolus meristosporus CBS 931.73]|eukprot:ORX89071.1 hypothetical protein K493DRAFT_306063 [Basidiobolus meristosporus CBS 931.73]